MDQWVRLPQSKFKALMSRAFFGELLKSKTKNGGFACTEFFQGLSCMVIIIILECIQKV